MFYDAAERALLGGDKVIYNRRHRASITERRIVHRVLRFQRARTLNAREHIGIYHLGGQIRTTEFFIAFPKVYCSY